MHYYDQKKKTQKKTRAAKNSSICSEWEIVLGNSFITRWPLYSFPKIVYEMI